MNNLKKILSVVLILTFFSGLISLNLKAESVSKRKYEILLNLCRAIADKGCYLKNYSFLYDLSEGKEKEEIFKKAEKIASSITPYDYSNIDFTSIKRNMIYIIAKLSRYRLTKDKEILNNILEEADSLGLADETVKYVKSHFNVTLKPLPVSEELEPIIKKEYNPDNIGILFLVPLTGKFKHIGKKCIEGILSGSDFFHYKNPFHFYFFDSNSGKENFEENLKEFYLKNGNIRLIIGPLETSKENLAVTFAKSLSIPIISLVAGGKNFDNYQYYFNHSLNLKDEMQQLTTLIEKESYYTGVLYPNSPFGLKIKKYFLENMNNNRSIFIPYEKDQVDFRREIITLGKLEKVKHNEYIQRRDIDSVFIADDVEKALLIIPQLFFYDMKDLKIYGLNLWNNKRIMSLDKKYQKSITYLGLINYYSKTRRFLYYTNYLNNYFKDTPDFYSTLLYDTVKIINQIDFSSNSTIKNSLTEKKFYLLTGETYFNYDGFSHKIYKIFKIRNGNLEIY